MDSLTKTAPDGSSGSEQPGYEGLKQLQLSDISKHGMGTSSWQLSVTSFNSTE
jgi:hypothetical protein